MYRENIKKYSYQKRNTYTWPIWKEFDTNGHWVDCLSQYDLLRTPRLAIHSWSWDFFEISDLDGKCTYKQLFLFLANKVFWVDALYLNNF